MKTILPCIMLMILLFSACSAETTTTEHSDLFHNKILDVSNSFSFENYQEVMGNETHILNLPETYDRISPEQNYIVDQKLFVYKKKDCSTLIILQMMPDYRAPDAWNSSLNYLSSLFNAPDSRYGDYYVESIPDVEVAFNSFTHDQCTYSIICFSQPNNQFEAAKTLTAFSNCLITFLTNVEV